MEGRPFWEVKLFDNKGFINSVKGFDGQQL